MPLLRYALLDPSNFSLGLHIITLPYPLACQQAAIARKLGYRACHYIALKMQAHCGVELSIRSLLIAVRAYILRCWKRCMLPAIAPPQLMLWTRSA